MASKQVQLWQPSIGASLQQRTALSKAILSSATSPHEAYQAAKKLVGQWPHARPADPETYADTLAAVLAQYPLGLVQECVDPRVGLARAREFPPTVAAVVEWCDKRLEWHRAIAQHQPRQPAPPELPDDPAMAEKAGKFLDEVGALLKANNKPSPLEQLLEQRAEMRSERLKYAIARARGEAAE